MIEKYLSIPYKDGGRDLSGCDCYGLVRLILMNERGIELPSFDTVCNIEDFERVKKMFKQVDKPQDFDLVNLKARPPFFAHIGLYYKGSVIQAYMTGVALQPLRRVERMVKGFYRPENET